MKIGIDIRSLMSPVRTGVGEYTCQLLGAIFKLDKVNQYFLFYNSYSDFSKNIPKWEQENVHYIHTRWPNKLLNFSLKMMRRPHLDSLITKINKEKLDIFFSPNPYFTAVSKKSKFILTLHDLSFEYFPEFCSTKQKLWVIDTKKQCQRADLILAVSENTRRDAICKYGIAPEKIKVLYPGISCHPENNHRSLAKYNLPNKLILFLATIEPRKNIIGIIEAFEKSYSRLPLPYSLVIAGPNGWHYDKVYKRAQTSPLRDKIKFLGYVDADDKPALYQKADLFLFPSFYEGFGFPVLEALACGTPVITSNRSSLPEITENAGYLINPNNTLSISEAIVQILNNKALGDHFKSKGLKQALKFNWQQTATNWLNIISNVCA